LAYALILFRENAYPCVFYTDIYSATYTDKGHDGQEYEIFLPGCEHIDKLIQARKNFAYGVQRDYFDHGNCIGWTREGDPEHPGSGMAILLSNGDEGSKKMEIGKEHAGKVFRDYLGKRQAPVTIDENGWGEFQVDAGSVSVWIATSSGPADQFQEERDDRDNEEDMNDAAGMVSQETNGPGDDKDDGDEVQ